MNSHKYFFLFLLFIAVVTEVKAQDVHFKTPLYGAAYYNSYTRHPRLDKNVAMMKKAGINVVRMGESSWGLWEPKQGVFKFAWMDSVVNKMAKAGIKVIMGTPTYSIPVWMGRKYPQVQVKKVGQSKRFPYGLRQQADQTNPTYRYFAARVIRKLVKHYRDNPDVIGYQIDNETFPAKTASKNVYYDFIQYLKRKFGNADSLNKVWGLNYWGQRIYDIDYLPPRAGIRNPGYKLEWERFQQKITTDFLAWQDSIVNQYKRPDQFVTQDFANGALNKNVNPLHISENLDIVSSNIYYPMQDKMTGESIALAGDMSRSLKKNNYLITETTAQTTGWNSKHQYPPYDGQLRLGAYANYASGANMVEYWHWGSLHYGQETYWKGILSYDNKPDRIYKSVSKIAHELKKIGSKIVNLKKSNKIAILYSEDSYWGIHFMPFDNNIDYSTVLRRFYHVLYDMNEGVDFVFPESKNFNNYKIIIVPPLYIASDSLLNRLSNYVKHGGSVIMSFKSGFANQFSTVRTSPMPGPLRKAAGFTYQEFSNLRHPVALKGNPFHVQTNKDSVSAWAEFLKPTAAQTLAYYDHPLFGKYPAIAQNKYRKGTLTYEGTVLSNALQKQLLSRVLQKAGLMGPAQHLPDAVRLRKGKNDTGQIIRYVMNFSGHKQHFTYSFHGGTDILTGDKVKKGTFVDISPWNLKIIESNK